MQQVCCDAAVEVLPVVVVVLGCVCVCWLAWEPGCVHVPKNVTFPNSLQLQLRGDEASMNQSMASARPPTLSNQELGSYPVHQPQS